MARDQHAVMIRVYDDYLKRDNLMAGIRHIGQSSAALILAIFILVGCATHQVQVQDQDEAPEYASTRLLVSLARVEETLTSAELLMDLFPQLLLRDREIDDAIVYVTRHPDYRSYHLLNAIWKADPAHLERISAGTRAKILVSAMGVATVMSDWMPPWSKKAEYYGASEILINLGEPALEYLCELLHDKKIVDWRLLSNANLPPLRTADYARWHIARILKVEAAFVADVAERDRLIDDMLERCKAEKNK
ncbi:MAG: hypothetical protein WD768_01360 [Phycisphaeraceae bacterium]